MPTLMDLAADLSGGIPGLPNTFARKYVNKAFEEVKREKLWTWNIGTGIHACPQLIASSGTVATTQFSQYVQFDATAQAAFTPILLSNTVPLTAYQFRLMNAPVYSLIAYNPSTGIGTLDRIYGEATVAGSMFTMYRCYYGPPSLDGTYGNLATDFLRHLVILNPIQGYAIAGRRLNMTREELDRRDPLRGAQGQPYYAAIYRPSPISLYQPAQTTGPNLGIMQYELWPHPTFQQNLIVQYEKMHVDLQPGDYFPNQCSTPLIMYRALEYGYRWAMQNAGRLPELKGVNWLNSLVEVQRKYAIDLLMAKKNDSEISPTILHPGSAGLYDFWGPIDSNFWQSHGLPAL